jgi:hypothetical protein
VRRRTIVRGTSKRWTSAEHHSPTDGETALNPATSEANGRQALVRWTNGVGQYTRAVDSLVAHCPDLIRPGTAARENIEGVRLLIELNEQAFKSIW